MSGRRAGMEAYRSPSAPAKGGSSPCSRAKSAVRVAPVPRRRQKPQRAFAGPARPRSEEGV